MSTSVVTRKDDSTSPSRIGLFVLLALCAGGGLASWLDQRSKADFAATLQAESHPITAMRHARISAVRATQGALVKPGDPLILLDDPTLLARIAQQQRQILELETEVAKVRSTAKVELAWRKRQIDADLLELQLKSAALLQQKIDAQVEQIAWNEHLNSTDLWTGSSSRHHLPALLLASGPDEGRIQAMLKEDQSASIAESLAVQISLCEKRMAELRSLMTSLETEIQTSSGVEVAETRLSQAKEEMEALQQQQQQLLISSPAHGIVGLTRRRPGDSVNADDILLELLDTERRFLLANIPSSAADRCLPGTKVIVRFPGAQVRQGIVNTIPPQAEQAPTTVVETSLLVRIDPIGKLWPDCPVGTSVGIQLIKVDAE